ncbi:MAG TPA: methyltransferase [Bacteriovoracaceae bacterium]|nr:methyltransferase [Bacteriovoracaceae bacterium]
MIDYLQPDFYRFNQDSLELVGLVKRELSAAQSILDLGAGCGVIGIELARVFCPEHLSLVEVQPEYRAFLLKNSEVFLNAQVEREIFISSFSEFRATRSYDLIVCNPPYYLPGHGQESSDFRRRVARSFLADSWVELLKCVEVNLAENGKAYLVIKNDGTLLEHVNRHLKSSGLDSRWTLNEDLAFLRLTLNSSLPRSLSRY